MIRICSRDGSRGKEEVNWIDGESSARLNGGLQQVVTQLSGQRYVPSRQLRRGSPVKGVVGTTGAGEEGVNQLPQCPRLENT